MKAKVIIFKKEGNENSPLLFIDKFNRKIIKNKFILITTYLFIFFTFFSIVSASYGYNKETISNSSYGYDNKNTQVTNIDNSNKTIYQTFNTYQINQTVNITYLLVNYTNIAMLNQTNNFNGHLLTNIGKLIMTGIINSEDIIPATNDLYSLGNSSNRFLNLFAKNIYSEEINATNVTTDSLTSKKVNSTSINSINLESEGITSSNLTTKDGNDFIITLK